MLNGIDQENNSLKIWQSVLQALVQVCRIAVHIFHEHAKMRGEVIL